VKKKIIVAKSKEVKTRSNLAESSKEGYGSTSAVLPMMVVVAVADLPTADLWLFFITQECDERKVFLGH
jgi:hypothetical protein